MRPETDRYIRERYQIRMGQTDDGHVETLTRSEVETVLRRVEAEAKADIYAEMGLRETGPDDFAVILSVDELAALAEACKTALARWTHNLGLGSANLPTRARRALALDKATAEAALVKIESASSIHRLGVG